MEAKHWPSRSSFQRALALALYALVTAFIMASTSTVAQKCPRGPVRFPDGSTLEKQRFSTKSGWTDFQYYQFNRNASTGLFIELPRGMLFKYVLGGSYKTNYLQAPQPQPVTIVTIKGVKFFKFDVSLPASRNASIFTIRIAGDAAVLTGSAIRTKSDGTNSTIRICTPGLPMLASPPPYASGFYPGPQNLDEVKIQTWGERRGVGESGFDRSTSTFILTDIPDYYGWPCVYYTPCSHPRGDFVVATGSVFTTAKLPMNSFSTQFSFRANPRGCHGWTSCNEGIALVLQNDPRGPEAISQGTGGFGDRYERDYWTGRHWVLRKGITNSISIHFRAAGIHGEEFSPVQFPCTSGYNYVWGAEFVAIFNDGIITPNSPSYCLPRTYPNRNTPNQFQDGNWNYAWVSYSSRTTVVSVFLSRNDTKPTTPILRVKTNKSLGDSAYVGLTAKAVDQFDSSDMMVEAKWGFAPV